MLATTRFPTAGGFSSTMRPTILTGFQAQWKRSSDSAFQGEVWWHDGTRSDGGLRQSLLEGRLSLLGPGETIANALQSCKSLWWNSLIVCNWKKDWKVRKSLPQTHTCNYAVSMSMSFYCFSILFILFLSSSQTTRRMEREPFSTPTETSSPAIGWKKERRVMASKYKFQITSKKMFLKKNVLQPSPNLYFKKIYA